MSSVITLQKSIICNTQTWLKSVIIGNNFCPFARQVMENNSIYYAVSPAPAKPECLEALISECHRLDDNPEITTTLLIFPNAVSEFIDYLSFLENAEDLIIAQGYEGIFQLASFHPNYRFADTEVDAPENYTNRSPYPMLHLLREESIEQALNNYPQPERIPERNITLARLLGTARLKKMLEDCSAAKKVQK